MTYREKLQKEHPENVKPCFVGGCKNCPATYGYGPENFVECGYGGEEKCTKCWDKVIPGTEDKDYEKLTRDELITIIKLLERRIDIKGTLIARYTSACTDKNKEIENLKEQIKKLESSNGELERSRDAARREAVQFRQKLINSEKELEEEKLRKYFWCEDNCCAMVKDKEIAKLKDTLEFKKAVISVANDTITELNDKLEKSEERVKSIKTRMEALGSANNRLREDIRHRDMRIEYLESDVRVRTELLCARDRTIERLEHDLKEEKKEHAKHHGIFRIFYD